MGNEKGRVAWKVLVIREFHKLRNYRGYEKFVFVIMEFSNYYKERRREGVCYKGDRHLLQGEREHKMYMIFTCYKGCVVECLYHKGVSHVTKRVGMEGICHNAAFTPTG